jgi:hypothetical protein
MSNQLLLALLTGHIFICLIFFSINIVFNGLQDSIYKLIIVFFMPGLGLLFFLLSAAINKFIRQKQGELESYLKALHSHDHIYQEEAIDFEKEINTVPLNDTLQFSSSKQKREYLIYILKKDFTGHIKGLKKALKSDDSETSHYAAAALMEIKKQFESMIQNAQDDYKTGAKDSKSLEGYIMALKKYLSSGLADSVDLYDFKDKYALALGQYINKYDAPQDYYSEKISSEIFLGDYENAADYCDLFKSKFPDSEKPYISSLKLNYRLKDRQAFEKLLAEIKEKSFAASDEFAEIAGYWEKEKVCL